jgi:hypothetical protein
MHLLTPLTAALLLGTGQPPLEDNTGVHALIERVSFELLDGAAVVERSDAVAPGRTETAWTPRTPLHSGAEYTWRVLVVSNGTGDVWPAADAAFRVR